MSVVHELRHTPEPHTYGVQVDWVPGWQVPVPLHCAADVKVEPEQVAGLQTVPVA
jgi:hypothetical protein